MGDVLRKDSFRFSGAKLGAGLYRVTFSRSKTEGYLPEVFIEDFLVLGDEVVFSQSGSRLTAVFPEAAGYLQERDVILVGVASTLRVVLSRSANTNTLLVTERCDNLCSFCSQPPKVVDDDFLLGQAALALIDFDFEGVVGISGGEPLLYLDKFVSFLETIDRHNCRTALHVLTNGRAFKDFQFVDRIEVARNGRSILWGVPLYSMSAGAHDELVGSAGAWSETMAGIINAGSKGFQLEIRFIPTQGNFREAPKVVEAVGRCLSFVSQISIMNLEPKGWARKNWKNLYLSPNEYSDVLHDAALKANFFRLNISFFNYPLCHISDYLVRSKAVKSISDWKNYYPSECFECLEMSGCGGFFSSSNSMFLDAPVPFLEVVNEKVV